MIDMADERGVKELMQRARAARAPLPRWMWIASLVVAVVCLGGFAYAMLSTPEAPEKPLPRKNDPGGSTFRFGLLFGAVGGGVIGYTIARQRRDHSSRSKP